jgi:hypothetical protein
MDHVQGLLKAAPNGFVRWPWQQSSFLVTLERDPNLSCKAGRLGINVGEHGPLLKILSFEEGLLPMWNMANPKLHVNGADYIMELDGTRGPHSPAHPFTRTHPLPQATGCSRLQPPRGSTALRAHAVSSYTQHRKRDLQSCR